MATTYSWQDAWLAAQNSYTPGNAQQVQDFVINTAISDMWRSYDWRGTVLPFTPFWVTSGEQDYGKPWVVVPSNFYGLREVYVVQVGSTDFTRKTMAVLENLEKTTLYGTPDKIAYKQDITSLGEVPQGTTTCGIQPGNGGFRIWPCPVLGMTSSIWMIDGTYKVTPPKITREDFADLIFWDDKYFDAFVDAIRWASLKYAGRNDDSMKQYAFYQQTLHKALVDENREDGEPSVHPSEAMVIPYAGYIGGPY